MKPWITSLICLLALGLNAQILDSAQSKMDQEIDPANFDRKLLEEAIFEATNAARLRLGYSSLEHDPVLDTSATYQAYRMLREGKLEHLWPRDRNFGKLKSRIGFFGGGFVNMGENIARNFILAVANGEQYYLNDEGQAITRKKKRIPNKSYRELAEESVEDWLNSPGHRANLLGPFDYLGVGVSPLIAIEKGPNFDVYLCQNFGTK